MSDIDPETWRMCGEFPAFGEVQDADMWQRCIRTEGHTDDHLTDSDDCAKPGYWKNPGPRPQLVDSNFPGGSA